MIRYLAYLIVAALPKTVDAGTTTSFECRLENTCDTKDCQAAPVTYTLTSAPLMVPGKDVAEQAEPATLTSAGRTIDGRALHQGGTIFWNNRVRNETFESSVSPQVQEYIVLNIDETGMSVLTIVELPSRKTTVLMGQCQKRKGTQKTG